MREMLVPIFGESGAVVAQFFITLVVVLFLIGLVYWLVRRFSGVRVNGGGRSRVPRLAVIDALPVDSRRRLVLVRRDNVEHLILIGGPSDLVVEPSIVRGVPAGARPRPGQPPRPQPQPPVPATAPPAAPQLQGGETTGISEPIPFPPAQRPQPRPAVARATEAAAVAPERGDAPTPAPQRRAAMRATSAMPETLAIAIGGHGLSATARFEEPTHPTRIESVLSLAEALDEIAGEPMPVDEAADFTGPRTQSESAQSADEPDDRPAELLELGGEPAPAIATDDAAAEPADETLTATRVSDLEREMARLLGEITARRDS